MIYSIGHGNKSIERLLAELASFAVAYVVDVRSTPASRHHPQFNRHELNVALHAAGVRYLYLGDQLGGHPDDDGCYRDGRVDYAALRRRPPFQEGIDRLVAAHVKGLDVAVMCSESAPEACHRTKAIGEALLVRDIVVQHILSTGSAKDQLTVMNELTRGRSGADLFGEEPPLESRGRYR